MSFSMNRHLIVGRLTRDPEERTFQSGGRVVRIGVATNRRYKSGGEWQEEATFHDVSIYDEQSAGFVAQYLKKGSGVEVVGELEKRRFTKNDGGEGMAVETVVRTGTGFVRSASLGDAQGRGQGDGDRQEGRGGQAGGGGYPARAPAPARPTAAARDLRDELQDDIPF